MPQVTLSDSFLCCFSSTGGLSGQKSSGLTYDTGAVVGISFLLLLLLLVLIKMYKNHQRVKTQITVKIIVTHLTRVLKWFTGNILLGGGKDGCKILGDYRRLIKKNELH